MTTDDSSRRDSVQNHLETLADRLKVAHQVVREKMELAEKGRRSFTTKGQNWLPSSQEIWYI